MKKLAMALALVLSGCVMPGDLEDLKLARTQLDVRLGEIEQSDASQDQKIRETDEALVDYNSEIDAKAEEIAERTEAAISAVQGGLGVAESGGLAGLITLLGGVGLNMMRNRTRQSELDRRVRDLTTPVTQPGYRTKGTA